MSIQRQIPIEINRTLTLLIILLELKPMLQQDWRVLHCLSGLSFFLFHKLHVHVANKDVQPKIFVLVVSVLVIMFMTVKDYKLMIG